MIGKTVGKYRIIQQLGRGGMGVVYKALDETLDREVAIKVFSAELDEHDVVKRFRKEATTLAKLNHPAIATIFELYRADSDLLMVMEYVSGETLEKLSQRSGPLPAERAAYLVAEVLGALEHAHRAGIVHRDIKPANVMVSDGGQVKVMDFGIARVRGAAPTTIDGYVMGTPAYMAPEQVLGQEIDPRADLYSVGVVFYRLLTAALPFQADSVVDMVQKVVSQAPTPARVHRAGIPEWCERALARALAKRPAERFQTADEFREALLAPVNALVTERTMALGPDLTRRPAPPDPGGPSTPTAAPVPRATPASKPANLHPSLALRFDGAKALLTRKPLALGGALALGVVVLALVVWQYGSAGEPSPRGRPTTSGGAVSLSTRAAAPGDVAPTSPPAGGVLGRTPRGPSDAPFAFQAKALMKDGDRDREHDARVVLADGAVSVTVRLDGTSESVLSTTPFGSLKSVSYSKSKQPLWTAPAGPMQVLHLDVPLGFFKGDRHWLSLRTGDSFVVLRINADDVSGVVAAFEERTGRAVDRLGDRKDSK